MKLKDIKKIIRLIIRKERSVRRWILLSLLLVILVFSLIAAFNRYGWSTGFSSKTFWDWLELLIIPATLTLLVLWANGIAQKNEQRRAEREGLIEREIASDRNQEASLQTYLDRMTELILKENLRNSNPADEVRIVARTRTLTVLEGLERKRKGVVLRFLVELGLVSTKEGEDSISSPIVSLSGADLKGVELVEIKLQGVDLDGANLSRATLSRANLAGADLRGADLTEANLEHANLAGANLSEADLYWAKLAWADLTGTNLRRASLARADLLSADLIEADLREASLVYANLRQADLTKADLNADTYETIVTPPRGHPKVSLAMRKNTSLEQAKAYAANFSETDLRNTILDGLDLTHADLTGARVTYQQLEAVVSLDHCTMPNGQQYDPNKPLSEQVLG